MDQGNITRVLKLGVKKDIADLKKKNKKKDNLLDAFQSNISPKIFTYVSETHGF